MSERRLDEPGAAPDALAELRDALRAFAAERDWERFHTPKNLAMALSGEAGELIEHFQWLSAEQSAALDATTREAVALEMADVLLYLVRLADVLEVDLAAAARRKIAINAQRYPAALARGRADKYDRLQEP
ncbi:MAG: nucleotide pyrophosphohydrolase [Thauera sp.]|nr:nucleotide pyrophosphohydrolase [Thauera sp.]